MKQIMVKEFISNSASPDGSISFRKARETGSGETPYFRFGGEFRAEDGNVAECLLFLNAQQVKNLTILPELAEHKAITVTDEDFQRALEAPRNPAYANQLAMAFTNFSIEADMDVVNLKVKAEVDLKTALIIDAKKDRENKRNSYLSKVRSGAIPSRFPQPTTGSSELGGVSQTGEIHDTGTGRGLQTNEKETANAGETANEQGNQRQGGGQQRNRQ